MSEADIEKKLKKAAADLKKADELTEKAAIAVFDVYHFLHFKKDPKELTQKGKKTETRTSDAHDKCGDARYALGDAHHQIEQALKGL